MRGEGNIEWRFGLFEYPPGVSIDPSNKTTIPDPVFKIVA